jgi:hypothetical protein
VGFHFSLPPTAGRGVAYLNQGEWIELATPLRKEVSDR